MENGNIQPLNDSGNGSGNGNCNENDNQNTKLSICNRCECTGKEYKNLKQHQKSQIHILWEMPKTIKDLEIRSTKLDNENSHLRRLNILLLDRIKVLETGN